MMLPPNSLCAYIGHVHTAVEYGCQSGLALGMGRGGPPKRLSCPPNQNVGKDNVTHFYDLCID